MFRTFDMILIAAMVAAAAFTYQTKHEAESVKRSIHALNEKIRHERDTIDILEADWALLTQPSRIQVMADKFAGELGLETFDPTQVGDVASIPPRPLEIDGDGNGLTEAMAELGQDGVTTGAVKP
ncbi:MAG: hypothetical protein CMJ42_04795 [Phyllobacteriaceae bacterium]|nr:hypothetical protein [Phyllobacteriaceae bacterium]MBA91137.1 hypothetical protein [Phyllobacteriaceae bacterium]|tara:strand:+ start:224 stop:598 length:375 start_codon:yes stop_codon:yes gene_type:complete